MTKIFMRKFHNILKKSNIRSKKIILSILSIVILSFVIYCYKDYMISFIKSKDIESKDIESKDIEKNIMSETSYLNAISEKTGQEIVYNHYNDFDSDGICEMFAIVGRVDEDTISGEIWFINQQGEYKIEEFKNYWKYPQVYLLKNETFIAFEEYYTTGSVTYLWGVKDGKPFQPGLTSKANGFEINKYNEVVITNSAYDGARIIPKNWKVLPDDEKWIIHTYNQYYYYWDGENFREYGALEIDDEDLLEIEGTEELLNFITSEGATVNEIYYRENKIIQINYQKEVQEGNDTVTYFKFISFRYEGEKIMLENCIIGEGNILKALNTSLAVYPKDFNINSVKME